VLQTSFVHSHLALKLKYVRPAQLHKLFLSYEYDEVIVIIYNWVFELELILNVSEVYTNFITDNTSLTAM